MKKVVVISGGSEGLGREIAKSLNGDYRVVILASTKEKTERAAKDLGVDFRVCDITKWKDVEQAVSDILSEYKQIDVLINNAGVWIQGELADNDPEQIKKTIEVNTLGTIFLTRAVVPSMKAKNAGRIININSQAGINAKAERTVYNASKWAITGFTKSLEQELSKYHIGVMGIHPALMNTGMFKKLGIDRDMTAAIDVKDVAKMVKFILSFEDKMSFPEIGIKNLDYVQK